MESLLAKALESKLKYWLRSFTRDQFKLQGRSVQLHNLDLNGEALHATIGLPPTLHVTQAKVAKLEIQLPTVSNVKTEPVVVDIDRLDLVLAEKCGDETDTFVAGNQLSVASTKSSSYGFADQIADGMTVKVGIANFMLETRGGSCKNGEAAWTPPLASITMRKLLLYTTNEHWTAVNLKEARSFFSNKKCIYVFKKLEWESISIDLLPHPNMFTDESISNLSPRKSERDVDGAKRLFFGGERFLENVSGEAYITIRRTEQNNPIGLEVQFRIPEALCPSLSEPGLRAVLRFMTGLYVCLNRGDLDLKSQQMVAEATGRTQVEVRVDHILLCITDAEFRIELILQSLFYLRHSNLDGECTKTMVQIMLGSIFLRDTFSQPSCTLVQPSMHRTSNDFFPVPKFASDKIWPRIYPLDTHLESNFQSPPMLSMYSHTTTPAPAPPSIASQTVIQCQPLKINLQEQSCLQIASFLADGIVVEHGVVLPDTSLNSIIISLKDFDLTIPLNASRKSSSEYETDESPFTGARLHVEDFVFAESPTLTYRLLQLENDPVCFSLWKGQPVDASQKRWVMRARFLNVALETKCCDDSANFLEDSGLCRCLEMQEPCLEAAMVSADGRPLITIPPPGGITRLGISCKRSCFNASVEQLLFFIKMFLYFGDVSEALIRVTKRRELNASLQLVQTSNPHEPLNRVKSVSKLIADAPGDSAIILKFDIVELKLLESLPSETMKDPPLVQVWSAGLHFEASYAPLGGAAAISSTLVWHDALVECAISKHECSNSHIEEPQSPERDVSGLNNRFPETPLKHSDYKMYPVFWIHDGNSSKPSKQTIPKGHGSVTRLPFIEVKVVHVIPYEKEDVAHRSMSVSAKIAGVRLGGGMIHNEALLHQFGVLASDGGPGKVIKRVLKELSLGPLKKLLNPTLKVAELQVQGDNGGTQDDLWRVTKPEAIEVDFQLLDWLFALEGAEGFSRMSDTTFASSAWEDKCWHLAFHCLRVTAFNRATAQNLDIALLQKINLEISGVRVLKPQAAMSIMQSSMTDSMRDVRDKTMLQSPTLGEEGRLYPSQLISPPTSGSKRSGLDVEMRLLLQEDGVGEGAGNWKVEQIRVVVTEPVEMEVTKEELENLLTLIKSEIEAASRITAGLLMLLELHGSFGQAAIEQLNSLGSGGLDEFLTPERARRFSLGSVSSTPFHLSSSATTGKTEESIQKPEVALVQLRQAVQKSQELCVNLKSQLDGTSYSDEFSALADQLRVMQDLILRIKDQNM